MSYWEIIAWLKIHGKPAPYPVVNERAVRASAGIMMLVGTITFFVVYTTKNYLYLYPTVIAFWIQFFVSVVWWPMWAPFSFLGRFMTSKQKPDYVGAIQKRFAWGLGLIMATSMLIVTAWFGITGIIPFAICVICLIFMRMESALWICVWCKIYYKLVKTGKIKQPEHRPACPGGACSLKI